MDSIANRVAHQQAEIECSGAESRQENNKNGEWIHEQIYGRFRCAGFLLLMYLNGAEPQLDYQICCSINEMEAEYLKQIAEKLFLQQKRAKVVRSLIDAEPLREWDNTSTLLDARWLNPELAICTFLCKSSLLNDDLFEIELSPVIRALYREIQIEKISSRRASGVLKKETTELTPRELEVLRWVWEGKSNTDIAFILQCSVNTVKTHLQRAFEKLGEYGRLRAARKVWGDQIKIA